MDKILAKNPATGEILRELEQTSIETISTMVERARKAQEFWSNLTPKARSEYFWTIREYILDHIDEIGALISQENGKPITEAIVHDILPVLEIMTTYASKAPRLLRDQKLPLRIMKHRKSYLNFWPVGVVGIIAPWNFPFSIPFGEITLALLSGNAVIFKPSEVTPLIGIKIAEIFEYAGLPKDLFQIVIGDGLRGAALVKAKLDKIFFTGSVATGKRVMSAASESLTPVILELGGKDPMIVCEDADLDYATSAALWGAFANSGQVCASIERIIVHETIHDQFVEMLKSKTEQLRLNSTNSSIKSLGAITFENQKSVYEKHIAEISPSTAQIITGGQFSSDRSSLAPTIVTNPPGSSSDNCPIEKLKIYREETFGPIVAITKFRTIQQAIDKANDTEYGLLASIITKDTKLAEQMARKIQAGSVLINEVLYTHGLAETPWGGVKNTGFGRVHSDFGFYEFVHIRHIHKEASTFFVFKSLWWFPYTFHQLQLFKQFMNLMYRRSFIRKLTALPHLLMEFVEMLKHEKRL